MNTQLQFFEAKAEMMEALSFDISNVPTLFPTETFLFASYPLARYADDVANHGHYETGNVMVTNPVP